MRSRRAPERISRQSLVSRTYWPPKRSEISKPRSTTSKSSTDTDIKSLEASFAKIAKRFVENRGIGYGAWRDAGVPAPVLKRQASRVPAADTSHRGATTDRVDQS